jgi:hypothetical protein
MSLLEQASLVVTPNGYKAGTLFSVVPNAPIGDLTFSRAGALPSFNATRVNSDGLIEEVLSNVPRLDYSDGGCPSLLIEPESRNLLLRSEEFDNASWVKTRTTVSANSLVSPDGNSNADTLVANVGTATSYFLDFTTLTGTGIFTASIFAKKGNSNWLYIRQGSGGGGTALARAWFDLNNGTIGSTSPAPISHSIEDYGNGWYRCSMTFEVLIGGIPRPQFYISNGDGVATFDSDGTQSINLWGAQLEALPYATSYIPTVASTVTRVAETVSKTGLSSLINSSEGVLFFELKTLVLSNGSASRRLGISDGTISNFLRLVFESTANLVAYSFFSGGVNQGGTTVALPNNTTDFNKYALVWASNRLELWFNGVRLGNDAVATMPSANTFSRLALNDFNNANNFEGEIKNLQVYPTALSDLEIETLTSYTSFEEMALALDYTIEITL